MLLNIVLHFLVLGQALALVKPPKQLVSPLIPSKLLATTKSLPSPIKYPQWTTSTGSWSFFPPDSWTSGFLSTSLYALNTRKTLCGATAKNQLGIADWIQLGRETSAALAKLTINNGVGHDVGFLSYPFMEELKVNSKNTTAARIVNEFAMTLAKRFNPSVGCTRSWGETDSADFQVIIDNMMNLELLLVSSALTGNVTLKDIAISHATTTMKNHIRPDGSTWHVIQYDANTGKVTQKRTAQGYSDSSTWARGQVWGIYGFANMYNWTRNPDFLETSRKLAGFFLDNLPHDNVVPWDFAAPSVGRPADSSAATIAANALLYLSTLEDNPNKANTWRTSAIQILKKITTLSWNESWDSLLSNGTVNKPANNYLTGIVYGDYYFIRAGNELISMGLQEC